MSFVLARHPLAAIRRGICYGRLDLALHDPADAIRLARRLASPDATIWTSPARRCRRVAELIGRHIVDDRLRELDFGDWEGCSWDRVPRADLDRWGADPLGFHPPGGETGAALLARIRAFHAGLRGDTAGVTVVIAHGGPLKLLAQLLRGIAVPDLLALPPAMGDIIRIG